ncbi:MAG TPA: NfeD family protein [Xanthobacteraceae bacterium]|jgi:membrane protein implicated in regulation of membrane protease activity|nr:NfeD family protein [Xanthobacteraceae bacterium]
MTFFASLGTWNWFILGGLLLVAELTAPGAFLLWLGLAALLVGIISRFVDWSWQAQLVAFAVFAIAAIPLWRRLARKVERPSDQPFLNRRAESFVGEVFTLEKPIVAGVGTVGIGDTVWQVRGPDTPAGSRVRIASVDGPVLRVERVM